MRNSRKTPDLHAGSMADIAFLLLIFFLVATTIPNDKGISRNLPDPCRPGQVPCDKKITERNVLRIVMNEKGSLLVNNDRTILTDLKSIVKEFIDNNGDKSCNYCKGSAFLSSSENPAKAAVSLATHREAPYKDFIALQDELTAAYYELRAVYAQEVFSKDVSILTEVEMEQVKKAYPFSISEVAID